MSGRRSVPTCAYLEVGWYLSSSVGHGVEHQSQPRHQAAVPGAPPPHGSCRRRQPHHVTRLCERNSVESRGRGFAKGICSPA
eukprot:231191-Chlamydomonas_euryale.AAC.3